MLIDSHCHLTSGELFPRIDDVLARAHAAGVTEFVTIATDLEDARRARELAARCEGIHVVCGIHPHESGKAADGWDAALDELVRREDVYAVGEMGLDYHYDFSDHATQQQVFRRQVELAAEVGKPIVIHCREAHEQVLKLLADCPRPPNVVFHCFTGSEAEARQILDRGYWISLTGVVTFKRADELREVARQVPEDRLMLETDSPYLSPEPVRNVRPNEPSFLVHTASCVARARGMTLAELSARTTENTRRFFNLPRR